MSQLTIYGFPHSTRTQRVIVTLFELDVDFKYEKVDLYKYEHKSAEYKSQQPFGMVPSLRDGSFSLFESGAMTKYVVSKYAKAESQFQEPRDVEAMALYEQAMRVEDYYWDPPFQAMAVEKIFKPMYSSKPVDERLLEVKTQIITECLDYYEGLLKEQPFLAGKEITLVDYFAAIWVPWFPKLELGSLLAQRPHFEMWWGRVQERKAWVELTKWIQQ